MVKTNRSKKRLELLEEEMKKNLIRRKNQQKKLKEKSSKLERNKNVIDVR